MRSSPVHVSLKNEKFETIEIDFQNKVFCTALQTPNQRNPLHTVKPVIFDRIHVHFNQF